MKKAVRNKGFLLVSKRGTSALLDQHIQVKILGISVSGTLPEKGLDKLGK
jgi:hypothetical protein